MGVVSLLALLPNRENFFFPLAACIRASGGGFVGRGEREVRVRWRTRNDVARQGCVCRLRGKGGCVLWHGATVVVSSRYPVQRRQRVDVHQSRSDMSHGGCWQKQKHRWRGEGRVRVLGADERSTVSDINTSRNTLATEEVKQVMQVHAVTSKCTCLCISNGRRGIVPQCTHAQAVVESG